MGGRKAFGGRIDIADVGMYITISACACYLLNSAAIVCNGVDRLEQAAVLQRRHHRRRHHQTEGRR